MAQVDQNTSPTPSGDWASQLAQLQQQQQQLLQQSQQPQFQQLPYQQALFQQTQAQPQAQQFQPQVQLQLQPASTDAQSQLYDPSTQRYSANSVTQTLPPPQVPQAAPVYYEQGQSANDVGGNGGSDSGGGGGDGGEKAGGLIKNRASAQGIASLGRGNDKTLVHMTHGEVAGLQALAQQHGGSLTINPHTGLPEAGFLSNILPMVATAVATFYGGPAAGAAVSGALTYAKTGNIGKSAMSAGMTYGMGQLASGMEGMGAAAGTEQALAGLGGADALVQPPLPANLAADPSLEFGSDYLNAVQNATANTDAYRDAVMKINSPEDLYKQDPLQRLANMSAGAKNAASMEGIKDLYSRMTPTGLLGVAGGVASLGGMLNPTPAALPLGTGSTAPQKFSNYAMKPMQYDPTTGKYSNPTYSAVDYSNTYNPNVAYAAGGGVRPNENQFYPGANIASGGASGAPQAPSAMDVVGGYDQKIDQYTGEPVRMAGGGLASLGTYAAGGKLLQGPGDGMSDSIPAVIGGAKPQRAALAQGEFVIPADVVSHLGNGSTDAGSKRLYTMMDKIRHARTGSKKQGRQINPDNFMPA